MTKQKLLLLLVLYLASAGITYAVATATNKTSPATNTGTKVTQNEDGTVEEDEEEFVEGQLLQISSSDPKDQPCPLNGKMYTKQERDAWEKRRPLAVMIENSPDARPQSGLVKADVIFEAMAEGGVTRFMGLFYCGVQVQNTTLAPVRSARTYFLDWASGFNYPLYVHVGGANVDGPTDALQQIIDYGWFLENDIDARSAGFPQFVRKENRLPGRIVDTEHTMLSFTEELWKLGAKRKWTNLSSEGDDWKDGFTEWKFADDKAAASPQASTVSFEFWDGFATYGVRWEYDKATNSYKRFMAGEPHVDLETNAQIMAKNAVIMFSEEKGPLYKEKHMIYKTIGTGDALIFQNGEVIKGKWSKAKREAQLKFLDAKGNEVELVRGLTWISTVAPKTDITY
jgi:hypothetical protein